MSDDLPVFAEDLKAGDVIDGNFVVVYQKPAPTTGKWWWKQRNTTIVGIRATSMTATNRADEITVPVSDVFTIDGKHRSDLDKGWPA